MEIEMRLLPIIAAGLMAAILATLLAIAATGAIGATAEPYVVKHTAGGGWPAFERRFYAMKNRPVEIRGKSCLSTCTGWLSHPDVCVEPQTRLGFHGPSDGASAIISMQLTIIPLYHFMPLKKRRHMVEVIADHYRLNGNKALGDWFISSGAWKLYGVFFKTKTGQEAHDMFGTRLCEPLPAKYVEDRPTR